MNLLAAQHKWQASATSLLLVCLAAAIGPSGAWADAGLVRLRERIGPYQLTVFTSPTPVRCGPLDVSVLVQDALTGQPGMDIPIEITAHKLGGAGVVQRQLATRETATNQLLRAALFDLEETGSWELEVRIADVGSSAQATFTLEVEETSLAGMETWCWIGWPLVAVGIFAIHQVLDARRRYRRSSYQPGGNRERTT